MTHKLLKSEAARRSGSSRARTPGPRSRPGPRKRKSQVPGSSLRSSQPATMPSRSRHGSLSGARVVERMLGEEIADRGGIVRLPGAHVALDPGRHGDSIHASGLPPRTRPSRWRGLPRSACRESTNQGGPKRADGTPRRRAACRWTVVHWSRACQPKAFPGAKNEVGIILLGDGLQTVPRGVGDHEHLLPDTEIERGTPWFVRSPVVPSALSDRL